MKEAQLKVLELLEAHKISVDSAALLLDAMKESPQQTSQSNETNETDKCERQMNSFQSTDAHTSTSAETSSSVDDFVNAALKQVSTTLRKATEKNSTQSKENKSNPMETFSQIEKSLRDVSEKLNKYNK